MRYRLTNGGAIGRSLRTSIVSIICVAGAHLVPSHLALAQSRPVALRDVSVVDVRDGSIRPNRTVLVDGSRISAVGNASEVSIPVDAEIVDGGRYVIPGLWDMHTHATATDRVESYFKLLLANGVTGIREPAITLSGADGERSAVEVGRLPGPSRMVVANNIVAGPRPMAPGRLAAGTPEEGVRIVDSLHAAGAPFVKVWFGPSPETFLAMAERSRELGLPLVGHVPVGLRVADASDAGQRSIEHLTGIVTACSSDEEAIIEAYREMSVGDLAAAIGYAIDLSWRALATQDDARCRRLAERLIENETWQVPTLVSLRGKAYMRQLASAGDSRLRYVTPPSRWTDPGPFSGVPLSPEQWEIVQRQYEREKEIVGIMAAAGVPLLAGTDATPWVFPGFSLHDELELWVEAGVSPLQALQAATLAPARFFGRTDQLGSVDADKLADLVVLDANPLEDITNTRTIHAVVADGRLYRRSDLDRLLAEVERSVEARRR